MDIYEKKYNEAQKWIESIYSELSHEQQMEAEAFFPELKKSEDEKVEKAIFGMVYDSDNELWSSYDVSKSDVLAWLEKQGEEKNSDKAESMKHGYITTNPEFFQWIYDRLKYVYNENPNVDYMLSLKERIEDMQKFADKIGPKFKVGDCIIDNKNRVGIIVRILDGLYIISFDGREVQIPFEWEGKLFRKWTIQDAKDGDVLVASDGSLFIFAKLKDNSAYYHFSLCKNGSKEISDGKHAWETANSCYPATESQRDTLLKAMTDAGYEWDAEKKELKKISQRMVSAEAKEALYDKPAWSEEDENTIKVLMNIIKKSEIIDSIIYTDSLKEKLYDWLKSLKERIGWKPSDEQMRALHDLNLTGNISYAGQGQVLIELYNDLKKLTE